MTARTLGSSGRRRRKLLLLRVRVTRFAFFGRHPGGRVSTLSLRTHRSGAVVNVVRRMNEVTLSRRIRLVPRAAVPSRTGTGQLQKSFK